MDSGFTFAVKNAMCTETNASYSYSATKGTCKDSCCTVDIAQGSVTGSKVVPTDKEHVLNVNSGTALPCPSLLRQTSPHFNRINPLY